MLVKPPGAPPVHWKIHKTFRKIDSQENKACFNQTKADTLHFGVEFSLKADMLVKGIRQLQAAFSGRILD